MLLVQKDYMKSSTSRHLHKEEMEREGNLSKYKERLQLRRNWKKVTKGEMKVGLKIVWEEMNRMFGKLSSAIHFLWCRK